MKLFIILLTSYAVQTNGTVLKEDSQMGPLPFATKEACEAEMNHMIVEHESKMPDTNWATLATCREVRLII